MSNTGDIGARFEHHKRNLARELQRANELKAQAATIEAEVAAQIGRISAGLPIPKICPDCWVERGEISIFIATRADDPNLFDRWGCTECGWYYDVPAL